MNSILRTLLSPDARLAQKAIPESGGEPDIHAVAGTPARRLSNRLASRHTGAYGGADAIDWVMDCVDLYAQTTSSAAYHFERNGKRLRNPGEEITDDNRNHGEVAGELWGLLNRPNSMMDYTELMELAVIDLLLAGEFFWYKHGINGFGRPKTIYRIAPALIEVVPGAVSPKGYIYRPPNGREIALSPDEVLHVRRPNPHDPWRGLGVIAGGPRSFDIELALTNQTATYYEQGTKLSGVAETDRTIPETTFRKLVRQFASLYSGTSNAGKVAFLERGLRWRSISSDAHQAQLIEAAKWGRERTANAFRVPIVLLGAVGAADRQAVREGQRIFDNKTVRPFLNRLQSQVSYGLTQAWGVDFVIDHEYVMPAEDRLDLGVDLATIPGIRVRELRETIGFEPLGPDVKGPDGEPIDEMILNLPGQGRDEGGFPDRPIGEEPGREPNPENTRPFAREGAPTPPGADATSGAKALALRRSLRELRRQLNGVQGG